MIRFVAKKGRHTVSASIRSFTYSRLTGAVAALWLCCTGPAWAGDGGNDLGTLNSALLTLCPMLGVPMPSCPQVPTITQGVLQLAAWNLVPTEMIRATNAIAAGTAVDAGNPSIPPVGPTPPQITAFPVKAPTLSTLLPNLRPLAFESSTKGPAAATQLFDPDANTFFYAVASLSASSTQSVQPDTLYLFFDNPRQIINLFLPQQVIANISLPLVVLSSDGTTERPVPTTLKIVGKLPTPGSGVALDCSASTVTGNFSGAPNGTRQTRMASQIGVNCAIVFAPSPISAISHAIYEVQIPLIVTRLTDPLYFSNPISNVAFNFTGDETGFTPLPANPPILGANGNSIGIGPVAVPLCTTATCPPMTVPPTPPQAPTFALCANLPGLLALPVPAVAAYYAISTAGETLISAALPPPATTALPTPSTSVCPAF
jgi:hypothetical protein